MLSGLEHSLTSADLVLWSLSRILLVPLLVLCASHQKPPLLQGIWFPGILTSMLGVSNGLFGSLPMILGPGTVSPREKELAGNLLTLSYCCGLTFGSLLSYYLQSTWIPSTQHLSCNFH